MADLTATRTKSGQDVDSGQRGAKTEDETKRQKVTAKLQKVFDATKKDVEKTLSDLDKKVDSQFTKGEKAAHDAFTADHKRRMKAYKDKRYSGFTGKLKWGKDKLLGMPEEANALFAKSRKLYVTRMQQVISSIADTIGAELGKAKTRIARGRRQMKTEVDKLPQDLRALGQDVAKDFAGKFDGLEADVKAKGQQLVQTLATKYTQALNKIDAEIKALQEANKGLVAKAKDAIAGAIQTVMELKDLLLGILAKAASAIAKIIKDPIGFLGNLISAVGEGLNLFLSNIVDHLKKGLVSWLLGTSVKAGIEIPARFNLKGIIGLLASMVGLTWDNIRSRVVRKGVPDEAMSAVESQVPVAKALATEGPAGAAKEIEGQVGDLKTMILDDLKSYLIPTVIIAGITWIVSLLNPASAFVRAVKAIIDIVTFVVTQGAQIVEFVNAVLDAVIAIAGGGAAGVPKMVEAALAASIPLLIGLLASLVGVGGLANKVKSVLQKASRPVNRAVDKIVAKIAKVGRDLWRNRRAREAKDAESNRKNRKQDPRILAWREFTKRVPDGTPASQATQEVRSIYADLSKRGLRGIQIRPPGEGGQRFEVWASASPPRHIGSFTPKIKFESEDLFLAPTQPGGDDWVDYTAAIGWLEVRIPDAPGKGTLELGRFESGSKKRRTRGQHAERQLMDHVRADPEALKRHQISPLYKELQKSSSKKSRERTRVDNGVGDLSFLVKVTRSPCNDCTDHIMETQGEMRKHYHQWNVDFTVQSLVTYSGNSPWSAMDMRLSWEGLGAGKVSLWRLSNLGQVNVEPLEASDPTIAGIELSNHQKSRIKERNAQLSKFLNLIRNGLTLGKIPRHG
ncbi:hypothetical protein N566_15385 [Streptomycetaceae bacterium MP113-05]|nr:hypothetical protein N566_15385 [Streptomycetaceae bacterium MP113-05]